MGHKTQWIRGGYVDVGIRNKLSAGKITTSVIAIEKSNAGKHLDRLSRDNSSREVIRRGHVASEGFILIAAIITILISEATYNGDVINSRKN